MSDQSRSPVTPLGQALGQVPSGLYILTVSYSGRSTGMLASWVQQAGFEPPMLTVAIGNQRHVGDWVSASGRFTLNQLPAGSKALIRHFGRGFAPDAPAFDGVELQAGTDASSPVLTGAIAYLENQVAGEIASGDHRIFLAQVVAGAVLIPDTEPMLHVRHNGFHY